MSNHHSPDSYTEVQRIFSEALDLFSRKNADYGDAWRRNGWRGNLSRIFEKADRVRHLVWRADPRVPAVGDEAAVETLLDMLNTITFAIINLREEVEYGHETPRSERYITEVVPGHSPLENFYDSVGASPAGQTAYMNGGGTLPPSVTQTRVIPADELTARPIPVSDDTTH